MCHECLNLNQQGRFHSRCVVIFFYTCENVSCSENPANVGELLSCTLEGGAITHAQQAALHALVALVEATYDKMDMTPSPLQPFLTDLVCMNRTIKCTLRRIIKMWAYSILSCGLYFLLILFQIGQMHERRSTRNGSSSCIPW